jgi:hypothetical protein
VLHDRLYIGRRIDGLSPSLSGGESVARTVKTDGTHAQAVVEVRLVRRWTSIAAPGRAMKSDDGVPILRTVFGDADGSAIVGGDYVLTGRGVRLVGATADPTGGALRVRHAPNLSVATMPGTVLTRRQAA